LVKDLFFLDNLVLYSYIIKYRKIILEICFSLELVKIADNGKSIGEVREKRRTLVQVRPS